MERERTLRSLLAMAILVSGIAQARAPAELQGDYWIYLGGPPATRASRLVRHPVEPQTAFAVLDGSLFKTTTNGTTWSRPLAVPSGILDMAFSRQGDTLLVISGAPCLPYSCPPGLYRSTDGGATWSFLRRTKAHSLLFDPIENGTVWLVDRHRPEGQTDLVGLGRSRDNGDTWLAAGPPDSLGQIVAVVAAPRAVYLARQEPYGRHGAPGTGVWRSGDDGDTWDRIQVASFVYALATSSTLDAYALGADSEIAKTGSLLLSKDQGLTWQEVGRWPQGILEEVEELGVEGVASARLYAAGTPGTLFMTARLGDLLNRPAGRSAFATNDHGASWSRLQVDVDGSFNMDGGNPIETLTVDTVAGGLFAATDLGVFRSQDGGESWRRFAVDLPGAARRHLQVVDQDRPVLITDRHVSDDGGESWRRRAFPGATYVVAPEDPSYVYVEEEGRIHTSGDGGVTFRRGPELRANGRLAVHPVDPRRAYYYHPPDLLVTTDGGATWTPTGADVPFQPLFQAFDFHVAASPEKTILYGAGFPRGLAVSEDNGTTWQVKALPTSTLSFLADPLDTQTLYHSSSSERQVDFQHVDLYRSRDGGDTWSLLAGKIVDSEDPGLSPVLNFPQVAARDTLYGLHNDFHNDPSRFQTATLLRSLDGGDSWRVMTRGLDPLPIFRVVASPRTGRVYTTTASGIFVSRRVQAGSCGASELTHCLMEKRFRVEAQWQSFDGHSRVGRTRPVTDDTGALWFFNADNIELLVKVVDGCSFNDHFWVFATGLTNVATSFTVTDTHTGVSKSWTSPSGQAFQPLQDTSAFTSCT